MVVLLTAAAGPAMAATPAEQELAERYAPVVVLKTQKAECDTSGEPYAPTGVETVLGNPEVALRGPGADGPVVRQGPTAEDIDGLGEQYYLDFPGDPRRPGCGFERDFDRFNAGRPAVVYAHVARQADAPGLIALQFWLYYYFNDFNNTHESDWEFVQLVFPAESAEEALGVTPLAAGYAQHSGGEAADWDDPRLERVGSHPVVYVAAGSHASFFSPRLFLGRSANEGFGCDDTRAPGDRVSPEVRLLSDDPAQAPPWLRFEGHWGDLLRPPFDGPTGPMAKAQWTRPIEWQSALRDGSVTVPTSSTIGPAVSGFFCGSVEAGSKALLAVASAPAISLSIIAVLIAGLGLAVSRSRWALHAPPPLVRRRAGGEVIRAAARLYRRNGAAFVGLGLIFLPLGLIAAGVQAALFSAGPLERLVDVAGSRSAVSAALALLLGGLGNLVGLILVNSAAAAMVADIDAGRPARARQAWRAVLARLGVLTRTIGQAALVVMLLLTSIVGIPFAIRLLLRWLMAPQVVMIESAEGRPALARSAELVDGQTFEVAGRALTVNVIGLLAAPLVAAPLLFLTGLPLSTINLVGSLIYVLLIPGVGVAMTLIYGDLVAREREQSA